MNTGRQGRGAGLRFARGAWGYERIRKLGWSSNLFCMQELGCGTDKKVKVKVGFFYSATYSGYAATSCAVQSQEVAVDWKEPIVRERNAAATTHTTAPITHTRPSPRKHSPDDTARARKQTSNYSLLLSLSTSKDERLSRPGWLVTYRNKVPPPVVESGHVTHPSTNRARRRVTSLI